MCFLFACFFDFFETCFERVFQKSEKLSADCRERDSWAAEVTAAGSLTA